MEGRGRKEIRLSIHRRLSLSLSLWIPGRARELGKGSGTIKALAAAEQSALSGVTDLPDFKVAFEKRS